MLLLQLNPPQKEVFTEGKWPFRDLPELKTGSHSVKVVFPLGIAFRTLIFSWICLWEEVFTLRMPVKSINPPQKEVFTKGNATFTAKSSTERGFYQRKVTFSRSPPLRMTIFPLRETFFTVRVIFRQRKELFFHFRGQLYRLERIYRE